MTTKSHTILNRLNLAGILFVIFLSGKGHNMLCQEIEKQPVADVFEAKKVLDNSA